MEVNKVNKEQLFVEVNLDEEQPNLVISLNRVIQESTEMYGAEKVEIHQVIPHTSNKYTVICNMYNAK